MFCVDGDEKWNWLRVRDKIDYNSGVLACGIAPSLMMVVAATQKHAGM